MAREAREETFVSRGFSSRLLLQAAPMLASVDQTTH
jgi:hypothetical protein